MRTSRPRLALQIALAAAFLTVQASSGQGAHAYAGVTQDLVDKVLGDVSYPLTVVDQRWSCVSMVGGFAPTATGELSASSKNELLTFAQTGATVSPDTDPPLDQIARDIRTNNDAFVRSIMEIRAERKLAGDEWKGPTDAEIDAVEKQGIEFKVCLTWLQVVLNSRPSIKLSGSAIPVNGIKLGVSASAQLWAKVPTWVCDKHCWPNNWCCWGHFEYRWKLVSDVTVRDIKIAADGKILPGIDKLLVLATGELTKLRLDYPILREIPLEKWANGELKNRRLPIFDAKEFVASLPLINAKYRIKTVALTGTSEIRVSLTFELAP
jgi:hypothetical protein